MLRCFAKDLDHLFIYTLISGCGLLVIWLLGNKDQLGHHLSIAVTFYFVGLFSYVSGYGCHLQVIGLLHIKGCHGHHSYNKKCKQLVFKSGQLLGPPLIFIHLCNKRKLYHTVAIEFSLWNYIIIVAGLLHFGPKVFLIVVHLLNSVLVVCANGTAVV